MVEKAEFKLDVTLQSCTQIQATSYGERMERNPVLSIKDRKLLDNLTNTEAGRVAQSLVDTKSNEGIPAISADKWNAYVAENFPHVEANPVKNNIDVVSAMNSLNDYVIKEKSAKKKEELSAINKEIAELNEINAEQAKEMAPKFGVE